MKQVNITWGSKHHHILLPQKFALRASPGLRPFACTARKFLVFFISNFEITFCSYNNTSAYLAKITTKNVIKHIGTPHEVPRGSTGGTNTYLTDHRCTIATANPTSNSNSNNNKSKHNPLTKLIRNPFCWGILTLANNIISQALHQVLSTQLKDGVRIVGLATGRDAGGLHEGGLSYCGGCM